MTLHREPRTLLVVLAVLSLGIEWRAAAQEKLLPSPNRDAAADAAPATVPPSAHPGPTAVPAKVAAEEKEPAPAPELTLPELTPKTPDPAPSAPSPDAVQLDIGGVPLARLLETEHIFTGLGSFRQLLPKYGIATYVHGTTLATMAGQTTPEPQGLSEQVVEKNLRFGAQVNLFVGAELLNRVFVEAQIFYDADQSLLSSDFAQIDIRLYRDFLFLRSGKFLLPMGGVNTYPSPAYMFPLPDQPLFFGNVLPGQWGEVGFELYGRVKWGEGRGLSYSAYVVNGLEQRVRLPTDPVSGGAIRGMRNNFFDNNDPDKAIGAQLQLEPLPGLVFGVSGYEGVYTTTGGSRLFFADAHMAFKRGKFTLRGEVAAVLQQTENADLLKIGGYALMSYRWKYLEPIVMFEAIRLDGTPELDRFAPTVGLAGYPFPQKVPTISIRASYSPRWNPDTWEFATHRFLAQVRAAF